jgi:hypothetical protein
MVRDSELEALLVTIGEESGIPISAIDHEAISGLLDGHERPEAMLVSRSLIPRPLDPAWLAGVRRVAIASGDLDAGDGHIPAGHVLKLPASLEDLEGTLRWLAWDGDQIDRSSTNDASSRLA